MNEHATIGVIGGSGLYSLLEQAREVRVATPFGATSAPVTIGELAGRQVVFLPRHGTGHTVAPHRIPYRANIWALASFGVTALITSAAVGGLRADLPPGTFVVPDQFVDRTWGRDGSFYDGDRVVHLAPAEPFDETLRGLAIAALADLDVPHEARGTTVVIQGPRFSTRAESVAHAAAGGDTINMTLAPEVPLALELGIGVANISFVTDSDAAVPRGHDEAVSADLVLRRLAAAQPVIRQAIELAVSTVPRDFRAETGVPADAIAAVLAQPVRA